MSRGYGSPVIPAVVLLSLLLMVLPISAANDTAPASNATPATTVVSTLTTNTTTVVTVVTTLTPNATPATTVATTMTSNTTPTATKTTATPRKTTVAATRTATAVTTAVLTISVTETPTIGSVMVYSSPTGASILIDGVYRGTTPKNVDGVSAGNHILRLSLSGYYDYEGSIYIVPGKTAQGYGTLQPLSLVTSAVPTPTVVVPVIVPVITATPEPTRDAGLLGNSSVLVAIIGVITALIAAGASVFAHIKPPKKE
ncbi:MAG: PEGA domain-containing protein [Methanoregula sp.]|nr:PEGA domain-containing protein [Methanoregula sp.]